MTTMSHPSDRIHLKVALTSLFILAALTTYSMTESLVCLTSAYFTPAQERFATQACTANMSHYINEGGDFPKLYFNLILECTGSVAVYLLCCHVASFTAADRDILSIAWQQAGSVPATLIGDRIRQLLCSHYISAIYFLTQLLGLGFWSSAFYFVNDLPRDFINPSQRFDYEDNISGNSFLCEFTITDLGNVHPHQVECGLPTYNNLRLATYANKLLCLAMAAAIGLHIIFTFLLAPVAQRGNAFLAAQAVDVHPINLGALYGFTDLYMVTVLSTGSTRPVAHQISGNEPTSHPKLQQDPQPYGLPKPPACPPPRSKDL